MNVESARYQLSSVTRSLSLLTSHSRVRFGNKRPVFLSMSEQDSLAPPRALRQPVHKVLCQPCSVLPACLPVLAIGRPHVSCSFVLPSSDLLAEPRRLSTFCKYSSSTYKKEKKKKKKKGYAGYAPFFSS